MRKLFPVLILAFLLTSCAGLPGKGGGPPSPLEVEVATEALVGITLGRTEWKKNDLIKIQNYLSTARTLLMHTINEDPRSLDTTNLAFLNGLEPEYRFVLASVTKIAISLIKPYLRTENPDAQLAKEYFEAVLIGSLLAVESTLNRVDT